MKYLTMMQFNMQMGAQQKRERVKARNATFRQIVLLPITGGFSLLRYLRKRLRGD